MKRAQRWADRAMALVVLVNLLLVLFDASYIPLRDWYLRYLPRLTEWYGEQFKGIEPHRETTAYLDTAEALFELRDWDSTQANALLRQMRQRSTAMVDENPFELVNKSGTLERIKQRMREHMGTESSKDAFNAFWSASYLNQNGEAAIAFFDSEIRPLLATNYYRSIGVNGQFIDRFWRIDVWFVGLFAADLLLRAIAISRRYRNTSFLDAFLWRWYDLLLFLPFWRWVRVIPATVRLHYSGLVDLEPVRDRIVRGLIANVAIELTEIVVLEVIEQLQAVIREGYVARWLLDPHLQRKYVDINGVNEVEAIAHHLTQVTVYRVLPQIRPELETLLNYSLTCVLEQSPLYRSLMQVPGVKDLPNQLSERLIREVTQTAYDTLTTALEKPEGVELTRHLIQQLSTALRTEIGQESTLQPLELLLVDLLEEVKINYVQQLAAKDVAHWRERKERLYNLTQNQRRLRSDRPNP